MKYIIRPTSRFQRDLKRAAKRGYHTELLTAVIKKLADGVPLEQRYRDHALAGDYAGCRECHITPDWLLTVSYTHLTLPTNREV